MVALGEIAVHPWCESQPRRILGGMVEFRAASHAGFRSRRFSASATVVVTLAVETSPHTKTPIRSISGQSNWVPLGLTDPDVRWDVLPDRIRPEDWTTEQADPTVPGSVLAAEAERRPEGFYHGG